MDGDREGKIEGPESICTHLQDTPRTETDPLPSQKRRVTRCYVLFRVESVGLLNHPYNTVGWVLSQSPRFRKMRLETKFIRSQDLTLVLTDSEICPLNLFALLPPTECRGLNAEPGSSWWKRQLGKYDIASEVSQWQRTRLPTQETQVWSLDREDPLEEKTATHSSILAQKIPQTEESGRLQSVRSQGVGHDLVTEHVNIQP